MGEITPYSDVKPPIPPRPPAAGQRQAVFPVSDGDVTITFPADLSTGGLHELGEYLEIFLKKQWGEAIKAGSAAFNKAVEAALAKQKKDEAAN